MPSIEIGSARAKELQDSIQRELAVKGWSSASDPVMAEFITIMIINSKSPDQITSELKELIGDDYDPEFTNWLFIEAADGDEIPSVSVTSLDPPLHGASTSPSFPHSPPTGPRIREPTSESLSSPSSKRHRSPTDNGPSSRKAPRTSDLPDRPRAMREDKGQPIPVLEQQQSSSGNNRQNGRSLLERMGPPPQRFAGNQQQSHVNNNNNFRGQPHQQQQQQQMYDPVQAQIDAVAAAQMGMAGFPLPMMTVDQMQMQEIMQSQAMMLSQMNQMMQQFNSQVGGGFNGAGRGQNAGTFGPGGWGRGRGSAIRASGRGEGPAGPGNGAAAPPDPVPAQILALAPAVASAITEPSTSSAGSAVPSSTATTAPVVAPQPRTVAAATTATAAPVIAYPQRPGTPTLCKYSINCTNPSCRYSHPSPAATLESALVLSNDACEKGNKCDDKDCTKSHISPATLKPNAAVPFQSHTPARYTAYAKPTFNPYAKPFVPNNGAASIACKFGANCTRANCTFQHPPGRTTLPGEFHRGLKPTDPTVKLNPAVDKARLAAVANVNRYNKTVTFNKPKPTPPATPSVAEATTNGVNATIIVGQAPPQSAPTPAPTEAASAAA